MKRSTKAGAACAMAIVLMIALAADIAAYGKVTQSVTRLVMACGGSRVSGVRAEREREKARVRECECECACVGEAPAIDGAGA